MDRDTFDQTIRAFKHHSPFQPFTVAMENGDRLEIDHPNALAIGGGIAIYAGPGGIPSFFDHHRVSRIIGDLAGQPSEGI